ncbi:MAG: PqqD family protein [Paludibacteraceae bacterium]|nr:PqqD family protein [Paludibacteraceae bacterium]
MKTKTGFTLRPLGKDYILIADSIEQVDFNKMITMNQTAAFLWNKALLQEFDATIMAQWLQEEYDVSESQALADAQTTLESWRKAGIIE